MTTEWTQKPPTEPGIYLRVNAAHRVVHHVVADGYIDWGWSDNQKPIRLSNPKLKGWWWLGPLPYPPKESGIDGFSWAAHLPAGALV